MNHQPKPGASIAIKLSNVGKSFTEGDQPKPILKGVNLEVRGGELVVLLGRSGSGKSTLLNILGGLEPADEGEVELAGTSMTSMDDRSRTLFRRRRLGFVFQFFNLIPTLTVEENLALHLELIKVSKAEGRDRIQGLLNEVGLYDRRETYPDRLSGGEQQRVAVAGALIKEPEIILADEPTGNLDLDTGKRITDLLDRLTRQAGRTLVMATHSREVMGIADRVITINEGQLSEVGAA